MIITPSEGDRIRLIPVFGLSFSLSTPGIEISRGYFFAFFHPAFFLSAGAIQS